MRKAPCQPQLPLRQLPTFILSLLHPPGNAIFSERARPLIVNARTRALVEAIGVDRAKPLLGISVELRTRN